MPRFLTVVVAVLGLCQGCEAATEEDTASARDSRPTAPLIEVPEGVTRLSIQIRSDLILGAHPTIIAEAADQLAQAERGWLGMERRECLSELERGVVEVPPSCLGHLRRLREALLGGPIYDDDPLVGGLPATAERLLQHGQLSSLRDAIPLDLLQDELSVALAAEASRGAVGDLRRIRAQLDALANGLLTLQGQRLVDLSGAMRFMPDDEVTRVVLGPAVSGWLWLDEGET